MIFNWSQSLLLLLVSPLFLPSRCVVFLLSGLYILKSSQLHLLLLLLLLLLFLLFSVYKKNVQTQLKGNKACTKTTDTYFFLIIFQSSLNLVCMIIV